MNVPDIGIIGGMGPQAGVFLAECITAETAATRDADHLSFALLSFPGGIEDRSAFLTGRGASPSPSILAVARSLAAMGATMLGMPCNTAHAPAILDPVLAGLRVEYPDASFFHLIEETALFCRETVPEAQKIGVLATVGTYRQRLYGNALDAAGLTPVIPDEAIQERLVHKAIYDSEFGIKSVSAPVSEEAVELLSMAAEHLREGGAEALILGCTELPLAIPGDSFAGLPVVDSTRALARALIRAVDPSRLKPV